MRIVVETWDPSYGAPVDPDAELEAPSVDVDVEVPAARWGPVAPPGGAGADDVLFVDGVQRVDARITVLSDDEREAVAGVAGSFAAGAVRSRAGRAVLEQVQVRRGLFTRGRDVVLDCGPGVSYHTYAVVGTEGPTLSSAMTEQMRALEKVIAAQADAQLVVIDGPLSGGRHVAGAVGLVKTHRRSYLPDALAPVVADLGPGERTPVFLTVTNYSRFSWYLRLPGPVHHPWAGVVRCEVSGELGLGEVARLADCAGSTLPRFASSPHREPRAPQNLTPVGALESALRHRLGDPAVLERMLRRTCAAWHA